MKVVKAVKIGRNLTVTIPRALCRELGWLPGAYISVRRGQDRAVVLQEAAIVPAHDRRVSDGPGRAD